MIRVFEAHGLISDWLPCATTHSFAGHIRGLYRQGFYVQDLRDDGRLIYFCHESSPYLSVNGFRLGGFEWEDFRQYLQLNQLLILKGKELLIYTAKGVCQLVFHDLRRKSLALSTGFSQAGREGLLRLLDQDRLYSQCGLEASDLTKIRALSQTSPEPLEPFLLSLIGKGKGLTPAGDDLLFGYLFHKVMVTGSLLGLTSISQEVSQRSTPVSAQFFKALSQGFVSEELWLLSHLDNKEIETKELLDYFYHYGHSSGYDMLLGLSLYSDGGTSYE